MSVARPGQYSYTPYVAKALYNGAKYGYNYVSQLKRAPFGGRSPFDYASVVARRHQRSMYMASKNEQRHQQFTKKRAGRSVGGKYKINGSGRLAGKIRRPRRNVTKARNYSKSMGVEYVYEWGQVVTDVDCQFIGHITHPQKVVLRTMWAAALKKLMYKAGAQFESITQALDFENGDIVRVRYQQDVNNLTPFVNILNAH